MPRARLASGEGERRLGLPDRPLVAADAGDGLGDVGDRVVGVDHGAVAGRAAGGQAHPGHALLRGLEQVQALAADGHAEAADLADRLGHALEEIGVVVHEPAGALAAAGLLVGQEREDDVARRPCGPRPGAAAVPRGSSRPCPSCRPRRGPRRSPRAISPENGCTRQSAASAGTTSRWPWISSAGRLGSVPSIRATTLARFCWDSRIGRLQPGLGERPATCSAAARSPGPE